MTILQYAVPLVNYYFLFQKLKKVLDSGQLSFMFQSYEKHHHSRNLFGRGK